MEKELIYKSRSFSSCILAAYKLLSENMKSIIRCTWLPVVLLGLFGGVCMALNVHNERIIQAGIAHTGIYIAAVLCSSIAIIACSLWATSRLMSLFNEEPRRWNFVRILKLWLNAFVICLIVGGVLALLFVAAVKILKCSPMMFIVDNWLAVLALVVIVGLLLLPLNYICMRYLFDRKARFWKDLPKTYLNRARDWIAEQLKREPNWNDLKTVSEKVRALYRRTVYKASAHGFRYKDSLTPSQALPQAGQYIKTDPGDLDTLRKFYETVRYAGREPDAAPVEDLNRKI